MELSKIFDKYIIPVQDDGSKVDYSLCKTCAMKRRTCCEHLGCQLSPYDLRDLSVEGIINFIDETECISIDWWEGNPKTGDNHDGRVYFLRMRGIGRDVVDPAIFGSPCSALTDNGCALDFPHRPKGARELIPQSDHHQCIDNYSKEDCCIEWMDFQDIMTQVFEHYKAKAIQENPEIFSAVERITNGEDKPGMPGIGLEALLAHAAAMALGNVLQDIMEEEPGEKKDQELKQFDSFLDDLLGALTEANADEEKN